MIGVKDYKLVRDHFGDTNKAMDWFRTYNLDLCAIPFDMIKERKEKRLVEYIRKEFKNG